jgi:hypothetical protein
MCATSITSGNPARIGYEMDEAYEGRLGKEKEDVTARIHFSVSRSIQPTLVFSAIERKNRAPREQKPARVRKPAYARENAAPVKAAA